MKREILRSKALRAWALALLVLGGSAHAQIQLDTNAATPPEEVTLEAAAGVVELSLEEAVELALRRNLGLVIERYTRTQARLGVEQELGAYDLLASASLVATDRTNPGANAFQSSVTQSQDLSFGVSQLLPTGGSFGVGWDTGRSESAGDPDSPLYTSGLSFNFTQPFLRDFGRPIFERQLLIAQNQSLVSNREFSLQVMATLQQVTDAYWSLVEAREQLVVARESLSLAQELHDRNRIQVEVGTLAPLELVQSEAAIATREEDIIRSQQAVGDAEDALRQLLNLPQGPLWQAEIRPETDPEIDRATLDIETAIRTALETRPEVRAQQLLVEQARIESAYFRNQKLPSLNLEIDYGFNGSNTQVIGIDSDGDPIFGAGGYGDALDQVLGIDFDGWTAQLNFGFPLQNRAARAASAIADLGLEQAQTVLAQTEQQIITEVRQAARRVDSAAKQIEAARASATFQERSLDAERKRYENGMSSSFEITRIQQDLTSARSRQVSAIIAYRTALTQFQQATGQLLSTYGVVIDDPEAPVDRWDFSFFGGRR
jgi:outer membrane protein TolC